MTTYRDLHTESPWQSRSRSHVTLLSRRVICLSPSPAQSIISNLSQFSRTLSYKTSSTYPEIENRTRSRCQSSTPRLHKRRNKRGNEKEREKAQKQYRERGGERGEQRNVLEKESQERQDKVESSAEVRTEPRKGRRQRMARGPPPNKPPIMSLAAASTAAKSDRETLDHSIEAQEIQMSQVHEFIAIWYALVSARFLISTILPMSATYESRILLSNFKYGFLIQKLPRSALKSGERRMLICSQIGLLEKRDTLSTYSRI